MSSSDSTDRNRSRRNRRSSQADQIERNQPGGAADGDGGASPDSGESPRRRDQRGGVDFGSFVSSSARSSRDLFKTTGSRRSSARSTPSASSRSRPVESQTPETPAPEPRSERPRRYWRDAVAQSRGEEDADAGSSTPAQPASTPGGRGIRLPRRNQGGDGGAGRGIRFIPRDRDGDGGFLSGVTLPSRTLLGIIGGVLVLLVLLGFALSRIGNDTSDDGNVTPTATVQSVFDPGNDREPSTPGGDTAPASSATEPPASETAEPTASDERPRQGGDNQLDPRDDPTETPAAMSGEPLR